ncbi:cryptochrome/photolyase family protein [Legionella brunensis]|uniref:Deoxyribodipyrimidine photo-lyase n=1 Tax=Legionella brunensis TaxID=29422 RepID=A0A0W0SKD7_9GAMM|nr:deoxyribodipyrimidine photo-lyase [Legionella brunensis]KTC83827.1 deoxyribodipyrimidine photolyase [Legionella brunensis]
MSIAIVWFRQDLRLSNNPALSSACNEHDVIIPIYIFDKETSVLGSAHKWWLYYSLKELNSSLEEDWGLTLNLRSGSSLEILMGLIKESGAVAVYWNRCYEPIAIKRDTKIKTTLLEHGVAVHSTNGSLLNEPWNIKNKSGECFKVFTPFWKQSLKILTLPKPYLITNRPTNLELQSEALEKWNLLPKKPNWAINFSKYWQPGEKGAQEKLKNFIQKKLLSYKNDRNIPIEDGTSKLSPHLHFGEISPWDVFSHLELLKLDEQSNLTSIDHFLSELGWREFSYHLLYNFPNLPQECFRKEFEMFPWNSDEKLLDHWRKGETGYPLIDAGMRELWTTGYMHNRVRMVVASFLTKDLLIDWRKGADWFLDTLVDADLANNSASWQWVAGCGADAAPYFRIFNPILQSEKFDSNGDYIRQWVPELSNVSSQYIHQPWLESSLKTGIKIGKDYPIPIVDHNEAKKRALKYYDVIKHSRLNTIKDMRDID